MVSPMTVERVVEIKIVATTYPTITKPIVMIAHVIR